MFAEPARRLAFGVAGAVLLATSAAAHARLLTSSPAANTEVAPPRVVSLTFNEPLEATFSGLTLAGPAGLAKVSVSTSSDRKSLLASPATRLGPGRYKVKWHAVARDGHRMEGGFDFTVR